jgi:hypothetical protein
MLEVLREHLKPVPGRNFQIAECIPFRFRCRQSTERCVLQYTLRFVETGTGRELNQWVTGLIYARPGEAQRLCHELQAVDLRRDIPKAWLTFEPVTFIPELQMLVQVFPFDRKLRNLGPVLDGALRGVEPQMLSRLGPGQWRVEDRIVEPTRHRTELGAALRYTIQAREETTARQETLRCYAKVYRNQRGEETLQLLQSFQERAAAAKNSYAAVRPIAYLSEWRTLVLEEAEGSSLQEILLDGRDAGAAVRAVARAVAAFNQEDIGMPRVHSRAEQCDDVQCASTLVQWACPEVRAEVRAITAAVVAGLEEVPPVQIHRDLKTDHVFLAGERIIFIDLDSVSRGDPVRDPAHLWAHIAGRVGLDGLSPESAQFAADAFVEAYFAQVPPAWRQRFPLHCAGALIEAAGGVFKRQEPGWPQKVRSMVEQAQQAWRGESC